MKRENNWEKLNELRNMALSSDETRNLVKERNKTLDKLNHNRPSDPYSLKPTPKPEGDFELPKKDKGDKSFKDSYEDSIKKTRNDYDQEIYDSIKKEFQNEGYDEYKEQLEELDKEEVGILVESNDGANKLLDYQEEKQQELERNNTEKNIDFRMDEKEADKFHETIENQPSDLDEKSKKMDVGKDNLNNEPSDFQKNSRDISDDFE